jgi:hypothetical protein
MSIAEQYRTALDQLEESLATLRHSLAASERAVAGSPPTPNRTLSDSWRRLAERYEALALTNEAVRARALASHFADPTPRRRRLP